MSTIIQVSSKTIQTRKSNHLKGNYMVFNNFRILLTQKLFLKMMDDLPEKIKKK